MNTTITPKTPFPARTMRGISVDGATAYLTHFPCISCAKILAVSGVKTIKYHFDYNNDELVSVILAESGIAIIKL